MNYGLYLSASGVLTNLHRQDVYANNLANAQTVGFKPDFAGIAQRDPESIEEGFGFDVRKDILDRIGGGVLAGPHHIDFTPANLERTSNPLDVALEKENQFFAVLARAPGSDQPSVHVTRDGRLTRNSDGFLVTVAGGHQVLGPDDEPIQLQSGSVVIDPAGRIQQNGEIVGRLQVAQMSDTDVLQKRGQGLYSIEGPANLRTIVERPSIKTGFVEASGTDPIKALMKLIDATKSVTSHANLIRYHDLLMDQAVNTLGRVVA